ncbi:hypothetical protein BDV95DRAFT_663691 [Massariosphaeria phaeospora]|uniref:Uncharacterized protein n=1 Tax=Massariosphaeria phaeospora TaxID=100035 RepID=A0A7C8IFU8_9PLEO|nr:hypothetical protein BDV95DRAFT_663691 [Massariosphaeria phaeospora]
MLFSVFFSTVLLASLTAANPAAESEHNTPTSTHNGLSARQGNLEHRAAPIATPTVVVTLDTHQQNVGILSSTDMYAKVLSGLNQLCPKGKIHCNRRSDVVQFNGIAWNNTNNWETNGHLTLGVQSATFPKDFTALRDAMVDTVARSWQFQIEEATNCVELKLNGDRSGKFCNVANRIEVRVAESQATDAHLHAYIYFNFNLGAEAGGKFSCVASKAGALKAIMDTKQPYLEPLKTSDVAAEVVCRNQ